MRHLGRAKTFLWRSHSLVRQMTVSQVKLCFAPLVVCHFQPFSDRGGGDLWIAVSRQGFRQRLRESQDSPTEIQDVIVGHSTPAHKMAGVITNALLQGKTVRMAGRLAPDGGQNQKELSQVSVLLV